MKETQINEKPEHFIAVDNVCAWPNLTRLPNGEIAATMFNQPCHGLWEGDIDCWISSDEGRSWKFRAHVTRHAPGTNRMNLAAGIARNGDFIAIVSGWSNRPKSQIVSAVKNETHFKFGEGHVLEPWVCRSLDNAKTWSYEEKKVYFSSKPDGFSPLIPYGNIIKCSDGALGFSAYTHKSTKKGPENISFFLKSNDDGKSWGKPVIIGKGCNETGLILADKNTILAAARTLGENRLDLYCSNDNGKKWTLIGPVTGAVEHPAHFLKLQDGKLLLTYGIRHRGYYGIGARFSEDNGKVWYTPMALVNFEDSWDGGYPSSVQAKDGTIVTAYYARRTAMHNRYHMGIIRWNLEKQFKKNTWPVA